MGSPAEVILQLEQARAIVLQDAAVYPKVVPGVLPVIAPTQVVEQRRWGADFLAETFASPVITAEEKQKMCLGVLDTLKGYLNRKEELGQEEDTSVVKSAVQCAASVYPLVFRHTVSNASDAETWAKMAGIKSSILRRMDSAPPGVRICCIKFVARVVQVQTPGLIADPRRPERNEVSLALVPREHPVIPPSTLEAEASGLLDRLLGVLQDNDGDALIVTATMNSLSGMVQKRANISAKILNTVLSFNPLKTAISAMTGKDKVAVKSMTRTTMSFLLNVLKRNQTHPLAGRIQQQVERLRQNLIDAFSDQNSRKRNAPDGPIDGHDDNKKVKFENDIATGTMPQEQNSQTPAFPSTGVVTYAQLFTLNHDPRATSFHVEVIPQNIISQLVPALLASIDQTKLNEAINLVRARYLDVARRPHQPVSAADTARTVAVSLDEDDYDPFADFDGAEQIDNMLDVLPPQGIEEDLTAMGPFTLPASPPLTEEERDECGTQAVERVFGTLGQLDRDAATKKIMRKHEGFNRLAAGGGQERDGWIALVTRLATRPVSDDAANPDEPIKEEEENRTVVKKIPQNFDLPLKLRESLFKYVMDDFRRRIDAAISWLNEEWYSDKLANHENLPHYSYWLLRLVDAMLPYLDKTDAKFINRFLSVVPTLPPEIFERIRKIALDPERVNVSVLVLQYCCFFRPPLRQLALDTATEMWRTNPDAQVELTKFMKRWQPDIVKQETEENVKMEN